MKMPVLVSGNQGTVYIDKLPPIPGGLVVENNGAPDAAMNALERREMRALILQVLNNNKARETSSRCRVGSLL
jgi:hypothetical protein